MSTGANSEFRASLQNWTTLLLMAGNKCNYIDASIHGIFLRALKVILPGLRNSIMRR
jgi:hypothetical protein